MKMHLFFKTNFKILVSFEGSGCVAGARISNSFISRFFHTTQITALQSPHEEQLYVVQCGHPIFLQ